MKAISLEDDGNKLSFVNVDMVDCEDDQLIIKVVASGVNRADLFQRSGKYLPPQGASSILGLEVSGVIYKIGSKVSGFKVGDKVCALLEGGGYAQYVSVVFTQVLLVPKNIDFIEAAGIMEACCTVWYNLFMKASLRQGQSLLLHGGASGIGAMAIQISANYGVKVYTTVGNDKKKEFVNQLGVAKAFNYNLDNFVTEIKSITDNKGVDVVLDIVGGDYLDKNLKIVAQNGKIICLSFLKGSWIEANFAQLLLKNATIMGSTLRNQPKNIKEQIVKEVQKNIFPLLESSKVRVVVDKVFPIEEADNAHNYMEKSQHCGKIILLMN